ncbi:MAG: hypothetical protein RRA94_01710 [Bacteroidota bacterium]|nr:hypothetical protein [Bacteroidota bacterium]
MNVRLIHLLFLCSVGGVFLLLIPACGADESAPGLHFRSELERYSRITVQYVRGVDDAFAREDTLFLTVVLLGDSRNLIARYRPTVMSDNELRFAFDLPEMAEYVRCILSPREQPLQSLEVSGMVLQDGTPVKGALPHAILRVRSYEEAIRLFEEDVALYPNDYRRYPALWYGEVRSGMQSLSHVSDLRSDSSVSTIAEGEGDIRALLSLAALYAGDYETALQNLRFVEKRQRKKYISVLPEVFRQMWNACYGPRAVESSDSTRSLIAGAVVRGVIQNETSNLEVLSIVTRTLVGVSDSVLSSLSEAFFLHADGVLRRTPTREALLRMELLRHVLVFYESRQQWDDLLRLAELQGVLLKRSLLWCSGSDDPWVAMAPEYGIEAESRLLYGIALLRTGREEEGTSVLHELSMRRTRPENRYAICRALETLAAHAIANAETAQLQELQSRHIECQCPSVDDLFDRTEVNRISAKREENHESVRGYRVPLAMLESTSGRTALNAKDGIPRVLFVTSDNCSVCESQIPAIARAAMAWNPDAQLFGMNLDGVMRGASLLHNMPPHWTITNVREVVNAFNVRGVPDVRVILNGNVVIEGVTDSSAFARALRSLTREK